VERYRRRKVSRKESIAREVGGGRFHREGPMTVKDLELAKVILVPGTKSFRLPEERMGREDVAERGA